MSTFFPSLEGLKSWFLEEQRDFPWRGQPSPYAVWVSEVMLQQTQAQVVVPYFLRWMEQFPTVEDLAKAEEGAVIKAWEGLGYYARARNLHAGAKHVMRYHGGELPRDLEALQKIPGLGPYTTAAILSFAFHQRAAAVDGNVSRVIARLFCIEEDLSKAAMQRQIRHLTQLLLPEKEPWVAMEGLIELGARVCTKVPQCAVCPLRADCLARKQKKIALIPFKGGRVRYVDLKRAVAIVMCKEEVLVKKAPVGEVMAGLYEFPYFDANLSLEKELECLLQSSLEQVGQLKEVRHTFTRHRATLFPSLWRSSKRSKARGYEWIPREKLASLPFSSGHRRILHQL